MGNILSLMSDALSALTGTRPGEIFRSGYATHSEPRPILSHGNVGKTMFNRDIKLFSASGDHVHAVALLDTQCQVGNWISSRLLERLGNSVRREADFTQPEAVEVSGRPVRACGLVSLTWAWHPRGTRIYDCSFYVLPESDHIDVLFGVDYLEAMKLVQVNPWAIAPLVKHKKLSKAEKEAIALAKERHRQEKAALEDKRKKEKGGQDGKKAGPSGHSGSTT